MRVIGIMANISVNTGAPHPQRDLFGKSRATLSRFTSAATPQTRERVKFDSLAPPAGTPVHSLSTAMLKRDFLGGLIQAFFTPHGCLKRSCGLAQKIARLVRILTPGRECRL